MNIYELKPIHDSRKSFYDKAQVVVNGNTETLYSYETKVATITDDGKPEAKVYGTYSATTLRHIKEFLLQNGYTAESKSQIENDYMN